VNASRPPGVADDTLMAAVHAGVARHHPGRRALEVQRSRSDYQTSCALENITVRLDDGARLPLILKDLEPARLNDRARRARLDFLFDPRREIAVYETILGPRGAGATLYGAGGGGAGDSWLLLQKVEGRELYQIGELGAWVAAAAWLAEFHESCRSRDSRPAAAPLLRHSPGFHRLWLERAGRFFSSDPPPSRYGREGIEWMAARFERVIERLQAWPATLIHGDFYASNVLARQQGPAWRACPVDWEMAAIGPGILDVAALASGNWSDEARHRIIAGYVSAHRGAAASLADTIEAVDYAQVYLGVQWLGWFGRRRPPAEHARDWLAEAIERARQLNL
jgi:hypothetical protein